MLLLRVNSVRTPPGNKCSASVQKLPIHLNGTMLVYDLLVILIALIPYVAVQPLDQEQVVDPPSSVL